MFSFIRSIAFLLFLLFACDNVAGQNVLAPTNLTVFSSLGYVGANGAFGDYDNDGDMDVCIVGAAAGLNWKAKIFRNEGGGNFTSVLDEHFGNGGGAARSVAAWADFDADGDLDVVVNVWGVIAILKNNGPAGFSVRLDTGLPSFVGGGALAWGDYDNDGFPDLAMNGYGATGRQTWIYHNTGKGTFENSGIPLFGLNGGDVAWADYDKDGLLDLAVIGSNGPSSFTKLYRNTGAGFTEVATTITPVHNGSIAWGDYDNDGYPDILICGYHLGSYLTQVHRNNGGSGFSHTGYAMTGVSGQALWADLNNDGFLDIFLTGEEVRITDTYTSQVYLSQGGTGFVQADVLPGMLSSTATAGDYNNDRRTDILWFGMTSSITADCELYRNTTATANTRPTAPSGLTHSISADEGSVTFNWQPSTDAQTAAPGLNYNLALYEQPADTVPVSPAANRGTGYRQIVAMGNAGQRTSYTFHGLKYDKVYSYSVQAVDAAYAGSPFAAEKSFATRKRQYLTFGNLTVTYGDPDFAPATSNSGYELTLATINPQVAIPVAGGKLHITGADTTTIYAGQSGDATWLAAQTISGLLWVQPAKLTVTAANKEITFGDPLPALTYTVSGLVYNQTESVFTQPITVNTTATTGSNAGDYTIAPSGAAAANYVFNYVAGTLKILPKPLTITITPVAAKTIGDADFALGIQADPALPLTYKSSNTAVATIDAAGTIHLTGAGSTDITVMQTGNVNYTGDTASITLTVNKGTQTVSFPALPAKTFGDADFAPGATSSTALPLTFTSADANVATITPDGQIHITGAGTVTITATQAGNDNYNMATATAILTVNKAAQQLTFTPLPVKTFGDADFSASAQSSAGLPVIFTSGDANVATITPAGLLHITGGGTVTITATQAGNANYNMATATAILTVNKAAQQLTFTPLPVKTFGDADFSASVQSSVGLPVTFTSGDANVATITPAGLIHITGGGTVTITATQAGNTNYNMATATAILTVNKAAQQLTFTPLPVKTFGDADFSASAQSSAGLPVTFTSGDANVATITPAGLIHITGGGTVTITATQAGNANYNMATATAILTVNKAAQNIQFTAPGPRIIGQPAFDPGAVASSGLPVVYTIENTNLASLSGGMVTALRSGITRITASQPGNNNYEAALPVTHELEITAGNGDDIKINDAVTPNGDGVNDYLIIEGIRNYPDNEIHIANASGRIVFTARPYKGDFRGYANYSTSLLPKGVYYYVFFYTAGGARQKKTGFFVLEY